jgi:hypothetical protein
MKYTLIISTLILAACTTAPMAENSAGGMVHDGGIGQARAFKIANEACAKYGKVAQVTGENVWQSTLTYACVAP